MHGDSLLKGKKISVTNFTETFRIFAISVGLPSNDIPYVATNAERKLRYLL